MRDKIIHILWDGSHIWGLMALRAIRALGLPCRLIKAKEIACNALQGKSPALLLAPGGNARKKALALGPEGIANIRSFVANGGAYLGFCGGAGLALTPQNGEAALALCPWPRAAYKNRLLHLISGHVKARLHPGSGVDSETALPVWWPGRFAPMPGGDITILAECLGPADDFWLADIPLAQVPEKIRREWAKKHGLGMDYLVGQPLAISGNFGKGKFILSYSHLETPQSPGANALLADILAECRGLAPKTSLVPEWSPGKKCGDAPEISGFPNECGGAPDYSVSLSEAVRWGSARINALLDLGEELRLFFPRASWLKGWRSGLPGMACNNLRATFGELCEMEPTLAAEKFWREAAGKFMPKLEKFLEDAEACLWDIRLGRTLASDTKSGPYASELARLFGHPMLGGGIAEELLAILDELIYLGQDVNQE